MRYVVCWLRGYVYTWGVRRSGAMQYDQSPIPTAGLGLRERVSLAKRKPVRVTITVSACVHGQLVAKSLREGRSVSNLAAFLIERELMLVS